MDNISEKWKSETLTNLHADTILQECPIQETASMPRPCTYSWVGNLERKFDKIKHLEDRMKKVLINNDGWKASDDNNKLGYVATKEGAVFEMQLQNIDSNAQTFNFMIMKSYGEKWNNSKVRVEVYITKKRPTTTTASTGIVIERSIEMNGFHDKKTSETYTHQLDMNGDGTNNIGEIGDDLKLRFILVGGSTFKIMGMAFCDV